MKKLILLAIVLCSVTVANAQTRFGIKAGGNLSFLYTNGSSEGTNADQYNGRFGYHVGAIVEHSFSNMFSIQPELTYLNHGANLKSNNSFGMKNGHVTLNTLQLPINIKATFNMGSSDSKWFVYAGPYIGYNMYGKVAGKIDGTATSNDLFTKGSDMQRLDYGVGVGMGIEVKKMVLTLSNQMGQNDISGSEKGKMKTGNISLSAGYFF